MENNLASWLVKELDDRGWSQRELARRSGLSQTTISQVLSQQQKPTWNFCAAVAQALGEPVDVLFVKAGLKPPPPPRVPEEEEAVELIRVLPSQYRQFVLATLRALVADLAPGQAPASLAAPEDPVLQDLIREFELASEEERETFVAMARVIRGQAEEEREGER